MNRSEILLSPKESRRLTVMEKILEGSITVPQAATLLDLSERHVYRLKGGMKNMVSLSWLIRIGEENPNMLFLDESKKEIVKLALIKYKGASNNHFSELLEEHQDIKISSKSIGRILAETISKILIPTKPPKNEGPGIGYLWKACWSNVTLASSPGWKTVALYVLFME